MVLGIAERDRDRDREQCEEAEERAPRQPAEEEGRGALEGDRERAVRGVLVGWDLAPPIVGSDWVLAGAGAPIAMKYLRRPGAGPICAFSARGKNSRRRKRGRKTSGDPARGASESGTLKVSRNERGSLSDRKSR